MVIREIFGHLYLTQVIKWYIRGSSYEELLMYGESSKTDISTGKKPSTLVRQHISRNQLTHRRFSSIEFARTLKSNIEKCTPRFDFIGSSVRNLVEIAPKQTLAFMANVNVSVGH